MLWQTLSGIINVSDVFCRHKNILKLVTAIYLNTKTLFALVTAIVKKPFSNDKTLSTNIYFIFS